MQDPIVRPYIDFNLEESEERKELRRKYAEAVKNNDKEAQEKAWRDLFIWHRFFGG